MNSSTLNWYCSRILACYAISLLMFVAQADADPARAVAEQEVRAAEDRLAVALSNVDVDALSRLWADDFVSTMADGRVITGKNRLERLRTQKSDSSSQVTNQNQQVDVHVESTFVVVFVTSTWVAAGKQVGSPYQATHVWAKRKGIWRLIAAHISEVKSQS